MDASGYEAPALVDNKERTILTVSILNVYHTNSHRVCQPTSSSFSCNLCISLLSTLLSRPSWQLKTLVSCFALFIVNLSCASSLLLFLRDRICENQADNKHRKLLPYFCYVFITPDRAKGSNSEPNFNIKKNFKRRKIKP